MVLDGAWLAQPICTQRGQNSIYGVLATLSANGFIVKTCFTAEPDPRRLPEASNLVVTATDGSSVDEPPLVELSASSDLGATTMADPETKVKAEVGSKSSKDKVNRLENLAQQIESFDPVAVFSSSKESVSSAPDHKEKVEESALFPKDINDETLIDEIVQDIVNVTDSDFVDQKSATVSEDESKNSGINDNSLGDNNVKDNLPNTDTSPYESDKTIISERCVEGIGKVDNNQVAGKDNASDKTSEGSLSNNSGIDNEVSVSTAEVIGNDLEGAANGTMTVSTESEGFNEEQNQAEPTEKEGETIVIEQAKVKKETIPAGKKTEAVKSESPTKKSKRKEDKSIGELTFTVKPVLSGHSKIDKTKILKTNGGLMKVENIAECSSWSILQYFLVFLRVTALHRFYCMYYEGWLRRHCVVSLSKTLYSLLSTGSTQEYKKMSWHDWKIVDLDVKH